MSIWIIVIVVSILVELQTFSFISIWFIFGGILGYGLDILGFSKVVQLFSFLIASSLLIIFTKPLVKDKLKIGKEKTNIDALIGGKAVVIKEISKQEKGEVKVRGYIYSALSKGEEVLPLLTEVTIVELIGNTLIVDNVVSGDK